MTSSADNDPATAAEIAVDPVGDAQVATVETDRFCDRCGYNLRTRPVLREARTKLLIIRCPECGVFHAAATGHAELRPWLARLGAFALGVWVVGLLAITFATYAIHAGLSFVTLDVLTGWEQVPIASSTPNAMGFNYVRVYRPPTRPLDQLGLGVALAVSLLLPLACFMLLSMAFHHWRRAVMVALAIALSMGAYTFVRFVAVEQSPDIVLLAPWVIPAHALLSAAGGLIGATWGREIARFVLRIVLPPRARSVFAFVWVADGLEPPTPVDRSARPRDTIPA